MDQGDDDGRKPEYPADLKCYEIIEIIGGGMSSLVCKAICVPMKSCEVAIKVIHFEESADAEKVGNNAKKMASLVTHPNIIKPLCIFTVETLLWVVMPFFPGGSLQTIMDSDHVGLPEPCIAPILKEVCSVLCYLHEHGHVHGDVKPSNIFVDSDGSVKLADLGFSASVYTIGLQYKTPTYWLAPEEIHSSSTVDIWYVGTSALKLAHGSAAASSVQSPELMDVRLNRFFGIAEFYQKIVVGSSRKCMESSSCFKDMVVFCLDVLEPSKRPTAEELLKHDFFKNCEGPDFLIKNVVKKETSDADDLKQIQENQTSTNSRFEVAEFYQKLDLDSSIKKTIFTNRLKNLVRLKYEFLTNDDEQKISDGDGDGEDEKEETNNDEQRIGNDDGDDEKGETNNDEQKTSNGDGDGNGDGDDEKEEGVMQGTVSLDNLNPSGSKSSSKEEEAAAGGDGDGDGDGDGSDSMNV